MDFIIICHSIRQNDLPSTRKPLWLDKYLYHWCHSTLQILQEKEEWQKMREWKFSVSFVYSFIKITSNLLAQVQLIPSDFVDDVMILWVVPAFSHEDSLAGDQWDDWIAFSFSLSLSVSRFSFACSYWHIIITHKGCGSPLMLTFVLKEAGSGFFSDPQVTKKVKISLAKTLFSPNIMIPSQIQDVEK